MIQALTTGSLFRDPEQRTSKAGKPFWTATVKSKDGDGFVFVKLVVFSETVGAEMMRLRDGDSLSAQGTLKAETFERNGETRVSLTIISDQVLALRAERKRKPKPAAPPPDPSPPPRPPRQPGDLTRYASVADAALDDSLPF